MLIYQRCPTLHSGTDHLYQRKSNTANDIFSPTAVLIFGINNYISNKVTHYNYFRKISKSDFQLTVKNPKPKELNLSASLKPYVVKLSTL